jgi:hypothetical protein
MRLYVRNRSSSPILAQSDYTCQVLVVLKGDVKCFAKWLMSTGPTLENYHNVDLWRCNVKKTVFIDNDDDDQD